MNRRETVLAALAAAGENASFEPVQVQKLFFLIDREASQGVGGPHFAFAPYDYGPFDRHVYDELQNLEKDRLSVTAQGFYRTYYLTPAGYAEGVQLLHALDAGTREYLRQAAAWVRRLSFEQLVSAIYKKYPDMKAKSIFRQ